MNSIYHLIALGLIMAVVLSSCSPIAIKKTWREPGANTTVYRKLLAILLSDGGCL